MNKWYQSRLCKGLLLVLVHVLTVIMVLSLAWILVYPGQEYLSAFQKDKPLAYEDSEGFEDTVQTTVSNILDYNTLRPIFETEGKYDTNRLIDLKKFDENARAVDGTNESGMAYQVGDLIKWAESYNGIDYTEEEGVIVCKKEDGTYHYYYKSEFKKLIEEKSLQFIETEEMSLEGYMAQLGYEEYMNDSYYSDEAEKTIRDKEGKVLYVDCWEFSDGVINEKYAPEGFKNLLELVNTDAEWNGKLEEVYRILDNTLVILPHYYYKYKDGLETVEEGNTNLAYMYVDQKAKKVYTNRSAYKDYNKVEENIKKMTAQGKYVVVAPKLADFQSNMDVSAEEWKNMVTGSANQKEEFLFAVSVDTNYPIQDSFYMKNKEYEQYSPWVKVIVVGSAVSAILFLISFIWLTAVTGHVNGKEGITLNFFDRIKTEIAAALIIGGMLLAIMLPISGLSLPGDLSYGYTEEGLYISSAYGFEERFFEMVLIGGIGTLITCAVGMLGYLSLVKRIKARTLWKNSVLRWVGHLFRVFWENRRSTTKITLGYMEFMLLQLLLATGHPVFVLFVLASDVAVFAYLLKSAIAKQRIKFGIQRIASGDVNYKIPIGNMVKEDTEIVQNINHIGEGIHNAVEANMKNERLKTDLITNVSHDIKTPLTSIINYVGLLKQEKFEDPKIQGYLEILDAKSQRLKTLTEDVVEASKISSGNITLHYMNIDLVELINQTTGEFAEKFEKRNLSIVVNVPKEPAMIRVDSRRIWRVIENIYNNAAKYAMEGTRIYADLRMSDRYVQFSLKNVSEQPLNISADELTERFIRGDVSRSTEGSGLGLSIAKNLTELQGGKFLLYLDGDLFKVTIVFPRLYQQQGNPQPQPGESK